MASVSFTVPHTPSAQPRQRHRVIKRAGGKSFIQNYTPEDHEVLQFKFSCRWFAKRAYPGEPMGGPLRCDLLFIMPRPKNLVWKTKPMPRRRHAIKPDRDNLDKAVMDSLKGILWVDDCQVCDGRIEKWIASGDEQPRVVITVSTLSE